MSNHLPLASKAASSLKEWEKSCLEYVGSGLSEDLLEFIEDLYDWQQIKSNLEASDLIVRARNILKGIPEEGDEKSETFEEHLNHPNNRLLLKHYYWYSLHRSWLDELDDVSAAHKLKALAKILPYYRSDEFHFIWKLVARGDEKKGKSVDFVKAQLIQEITRNILVIKEICNELPSAVNIPDLAGFLLKELENKGLEPHLATEEISKQLTLLADFNSRVEPTSTPTDHRFSILGLIGKLKSPKHGAGGAVITWRVQVETEASSEVENETPFPVELIPPLQHHHASYSEIAGCVATAVNKKFKEKTVYRIKAWLTDFFPNKGQASDYDLPTVFYYTEGPSFGLPFSLIYRCILLPYYTLSEKWASTGMIKDGNVVKVDGVGDKLRAAHSRELKRVFLPAQNSGSIPSDIDIKTEYVSDLNSFFNKASLVDPFNYHKSRGYLQVIQDSRFQDLTSTQGQTIYDTEFWDAYKELGAKLTEDPFSHNLIMVRTPQVAKQVAYSFAASIASKREKWDPEHSNKEPVAVPIVLSAPKGEGAWQAGEHMSLIDKMLDSLKATQAEFPSDSDIKDHIHNSLFGQNHQYIFFVYHDEPYGESYQSIIEVNGEKQFGRLEFAHLLRQFWFKQLIYTSGLSNWGVIPKRKHTLVMLSQYHDQKHFWVENIGTRWIQKPSDNGVYYRGTLN